MYEKERADIRVLSNIADAQGLDRARDLLRIAESEFKAKSDWFEQVFCTKDCGDGSTIYDTRPRIGA